MITTLQTLKTKFYADSVEWCPVSKDSSVLLVGNYQLVEELQRSEQQDEENSNVNCRVGRLYVYQLKSKDSQELLSIDEELNHSGILDIKWFHSDLNGHSSFALVDAEGQLCLYRLEGEDQKHVSLTSSEELDSNVIGLSLDWSIPQQTRDPSIIASSSDGKISLWQVTNTGLKNIIRWKAHDFEAWISAFDYWDENLAYTGGDDCRFKGWDLRSSQSKPVFTSKIHSMGVCSIQSNPKLPHILATGSYDEQLMLWDTRSMKAPLRSKSLGGGIWRIKWHPSSGNCIATATMYNGFHIIDCGFHTADAEMNIVEHYCHEDILAYGIDWFQGERPVPHDCDSEVLASCSFYDSSLQLWQWQHDNQLKS
ncbi:diphthine methyltransferase [Octopus sinensis]|uniref:methylated diphthine methylhydrolase n=1 Tax=Octopus sinensis TaxID=2607531 RepID=A0A6P7SUN5_9MOLL|nr:diphthine methyltransferase [Octopus sinensis]